MDIEKLKETLLANGVDEETAAKVIADMEKPEDEKTEVEDEGKSEEEVPPSSEDDKGEDESNGDDEDGANEEGELPPEEDVPPVPQEELPSVEIPQEMPVEEPAPQELPPEVPPVEEQPLPPTPGFDPTEMLGKLDEYKATIDGLLARVDSLEQALKQVGVLDESDGEEVGVDNPNVPPSNPGAVDEFDDALAVLNGKKHY